MIPKIIVLHHSVSSRDKTTVQDINNWHKLRWTDFKSYLGWNVGYHFIITGDGKITQTRLVNELGAHCIPNEGKIGICLTGNFMIEKPSTEQIDSLNLLVNKIKKEYNIEEVFGHRDFNKTECCGDELYKWVLQQKINWLQKLINLLLKNRKI